MIRENEILKIYGTDFKAMTKELLAAADTSALIESCANSGEADPRNIRIGIKPNLVTPSPAEFGATTHPEIVAGIIEYLREHGFENIVIAEGSWVGDETADAFEYCGYRELCEEYGVPFIDTKKENGHAVDCAGMKLSVTDVVDRIDFLINVPVLKGHCQTKVTCALKNLKGLLPDSEKARFHRMGLHDPIAHLQAGIHQDLIIVDHICGDLDFEEGGNPVVRNCIMAALDPVLTDSYACYLMGYTPDDVPYIRKAEQLGIGSTDLSAANIVTLRRDHMRRDHETESPDENEEHEESFEMRDIPRKHRILDVSYAAEDADACSSCYANLTGALRRLKEEGLLDRLQERIGIGQGMRGKTGRLGVGRCTKDFEVSIDGCPPEEEKIYQELKAYIVNR